MKVVKLLLVSITLMFLVSCAGGMGPIFLPFEPTVGNLNAEHQWMKGMDWACARHIEGNFIGCGACHEVN